MLITVAEHLDTATYTKADAPYRFKELVPSLKLNVIATIPTDNYPYHYMTSLWTPLADPTRLLKLAQSSQEWCGTTFKEITGWSGDPVLRFHSYWGAQGDGQHRLPLDGAVLEDLLPLALRTLPFAPGLRIPVRLVRSLVDTKAALPAVRDAVVEVTGQVDGVWAVQVHVPDGALSYGFASESSHVMTRLSTPDGRRLSLISVSRRRYW